MLEDIGWLHTTSKRFSSRLVPDFCYQKLRWLLLGQDAQDPADPAKMTHKEKDTYYSDSKCIEMLPTCGALIIYFEIPRRIQGSCRCSFFHVFLSWLCLASTEWTLYQSSEGFGGPGSWRGILALQSRKDGWPTANTPQDSYGVGWSLRFNRSIHVSYYFWWYPWQDVKRLS